MVTVSILLAVWSTVRVNFLTTMQCERVSGATSGHSYFGFDSDDFIVPLGPLKYGLRRKVLVRDKSGNKKWCGWIKVWDSGDNCGRRDGPWDHKWVSGDITWSVGDTLEESACTPARKTVTVTYLTGARGNRLSSTTGEPYFSFDLDDFVVPMGPLSYGLRKKVLVKDKSGNRKWCGWIKMWDGQIHGRLDGEVDQQWVSGDITWSVGDTFEESTCS